MNDYNKYIGIRQFFTRQIFPNPDLSKFSIVKILRRTVILTYISIHLSLIKGTILCHVIHIY